MKPKSHKVFKTDIAKEVGVHASVVDEFVSFYYSRVRSTLSNLEHSKVFIDGLGTFSIRKVKLEKAIKKNKSYLGNLEKNTYKGYNKTINIQKKISQLEEILKKMEIVIEKKRNFKLKNNESTEV